MGVGRVVVVTEAEAVVESSQPNSVGNRSSARRTSMVGSIVFMTRSNILASATIPERPPGRPSSARSVVASKPMDEPRLAKVAGRLACPWCRSGGLEHRGDDTTATLRCPACGRVTSVDGGVWRAMGPHRAPLTPAQLVNRLPATARIYERWWRIRSLSLLSGRPFPVAEGLGELVAAIEPAGGQVIVDVACSEGLYARHLAGTGTLVLAVDHATPFLEAAQRRAAAAGVAVLAVQAPAQHLPDRRQSARGRDGWVAQRDRRPGRGRRRDGPYHQAGRTGLLDEPDPGAMGRGRVLQRAARPSGIAFPTADETRATFTRHGWAVVAGRSDGVVLRLTLARR